MQEFGVSQTCYRYQTKLSSNNEEIADWLVGLPDNQLRLRLMVSVSGMTLSRRHSQFKIQMLALRTGHQVKERRAATRSGLPA